MNISDSVNRMIFNTLSKIGYKELDKISRKMEYVQNLDDKDEDNPILKSSFNFGGQLMLSMYYDSIRRDLAIDQLLSVFYLTLNISKEDEEDQDMKVINLLRESIENARKMLKINPFEFVVGKDIREIEESLKEGDEEWAKIMELSDESE